MPAPTHAHLSCAIRAQIDEWIADGTVPDVRTIGGGHCYDFTAAVMERMGVSDDHGAGRLPAESAGHLIDCVTEDWWVRILNTDGSDAGEAEPFVADNPRLRREGAPLPDGINEDDLAGAIGSMTHNWLVLDGRHYDATCPEGAEHWLLMPFFADQISKLKNACRQSACESHQDIAA